MLIDISADKEKIQEDLNKIREYFKNSPPVFKTVKACKYRLPCGLCEIRLKNGINYICSGVSEEV